MSTRDELILGISFFVMSGHVEGWRLATEDNDRERLRYYRDLAREAEAAGLHFMFLGDSLDGAARIGRGWTPSLEPQTLAAALAAGTESLGYIPSTSSLYQDPFTLARSLATLDHLSEGRIGWNILTSFYRDSARENYTTGRSFAYEDRYAISQEFIDTLDALWTAWEPDAVLRDRALGHYVEADRIHRIAHHGRWFSVEGALNVSRSPQGRPVLFVPVVSADGQDFAARNADVVFTRQPVLEEAQAFYRQVKEKAEGAGRDPSQVKVTPGLITVLGATEAEAHAEWARIRPFLDPAKNRADLEATLGLEAGAVPDDRPVSALTVATDSPRARAFLAIGRDEGLSFAELADRTASSRGFALFIGTTETVADQIELWFRSGAADGFVLGPIVAPDGFAPIHRDLVPELQRRGLFRKAGVKGQTLRDALGLAAFPAQEIA